MCPRMAKVIKETHNKAIVAERNFLGLAPLRNHAVQFPKTVDRAVVATAAQPILPRFEITTPPPSSAATAINLNNSRGRHDR